MDNQTQPKNKKGKIGFILVITVAALLVALIAAGVLTEWFGFGGPLTKLASASTWLMEEKSFTADYTLRMEAVKAEGTVTCRVDLKQRLLQLQGNMRGGILRVHYAIYEDQFLLWYDDEKPLRVDLSKELARLYDSAAEEKDLTESLDNLLESLITALELEGVDVEQARKCLPGAFLQINRTPWLEEHLAMSLRREGEETIYSFAPDAKTLPASLLPLFRDAFESGDAYDAAMTKLTEKGADLREKLGLTLEFGIVGRRLNTVQAQLELSGKTVQVALELSAPDPSAIDLAQLRSITEK